jgi:histidyl-tRNA synthetase
MKEIKDTCYKGTRILVGNEKRFIINKMCDYLIEKGYIEISIPIIQMQDTFANKVGAENNNLMFNFTDRGNRNVCLSPEYTAVIQKLSNTQFKFQRDLKLFYVQECFRGENPQAG